MEIAILNHVIKIVMKMSWVDSHFFYLAFENSVCRHYVTEKFWYPFRKLAVPVVLSRAALPGLNIPSDSFIGADDFANAQDLAKYLIEMSRNEKEYLRFFNWTRYYRKESVIEPSERAICKLCELAHSKIKPGALTIPDIHNYWVKGGQCIKRFAWWKLIANRSKIKEVEKKT
uniref:Fucosyltransferase n=1 Tax=Meloidogyne javanica TaxID=6303 RepID=A0A915M4F9_MELJA